MFAQAGVVQKLNILCTWFMHTSSIPGSKEKGPWLKGYWNHMKMWIWGVRVHGVGVHGYMYNSCGLFIKYVLTSIVPLYSVHAGCLKAFIWIQGGAYCVRKPQAQGAPNSWLRSDNDMSERSEYSKLEPTLEMLKDNKTYYSISRF